jgi:hypothetical protein
MLNHRTPESALRNSAKMSSAFDNSDVSVSGGTLSDFTQDGTAIRRDFLRVTDAVETTGSVSVAAHKLHPI